MKKRSFLTFRVRLWFDRLTTPIVRPRGSRRGKIEGRLTRSPICNLLFAILLSGCVAFQVGGEIQAGRKALQVGDPNGALAHFQRAAELDPNYLLNFSLFDEGVWTYVGRSYYDLGKLPEARQALERARSHYEQDHLAKLYLGMVLARDGDRPRGLREMEAGLKGLEGWFDNLSSEESRFWDPGGEFQGEIKGFLAMIGGRDISLAEIIARGEQLGQEIEEEIDLVKEVVMSEGES